MISCSVIPCFRGAVRDNENRDLERQRHPRAAGAAARLARRRKARHRLPAGDQGVARSADRSSCATSRATGATGTARRATRVSRCWSRSRWPARCRCARIPGSISSSASPARRVPSPAGDVMIASVYVPNGGKDFDAKMRFLAGARGVRGRRGARRQAADPLRRSQRRARRARHPPEAAQAEPDRRDARRTGAARAHHLARPGRRASLVRARQRRPVHVVGAVAQP